MPTGKRPRSTTPGTPVKLDVKAAKTEASPVLPDPTPRKRRRPYTRAEWVKIRPILRYLYIDLDMTLQEVMQTLDEQHGFSAT